MIRCVVLLGSLVDVTLLVEGSRDDVGREYVEVDDDEDGREYVDVEDGLVDDVEDEEVTLTLFALVPELGVIVEGRFDPTVVLIISTKGAEVLYVTCVDGLL